MSGDSIKLVLGCVVIVVIIWALMRTPANKVVNKDPWWKPDGDPGTDTRDFD